jgi:aconitate hydratase
MPLVFEREEDYDLIDVNDRLELVDAISQVKAGRLITIRNITKDIDIRLRLELSTREREMILAGGLLNLTKKTRS